MEKAKILAVDDDIRNLEIIKEIVEDLYGLRTATSGEEALELIHQEVPDIILLDIMMTGIDGYEVCRRVKSMDGIIPPKIILVSGKALVEERLRGYEVGADDYLTKPFNDDEFLAKIKVFLKLISTEKELRELTGNLEKQVEIRTNQLIESEKMAFLGMHVAEIVHNLKNPLTIIKASAQRLSKDFPENKLIEKIGKGGDKLHTIITSILSSRDAESSIVEVDLRKLLKSEMELLKEKPVFKKEIEVIWDLNEVPAIRGSEIHFAQIFSNLIGNAIDAVHDSQNKKISIKSEYTAKQIRISIADTGPGISEENLAKIFDPFFTTKPISAGDDEPTGTGLGLPSCLRMIESYGGKLEVKTKEGEGSTFTLVLPHVA